MQSNQRNHRWTSGFKNVMVFRQVLGEPELEVRILYLNIGCWDTKMAAESTLIDHSHQLQLLARYDHGGFDFRMHGSYAFVGRRRDAARTPVFVVAVKQSIYRWAFWGSDLRLLNGWLGLSFFWFSCGMS